MVVRVRHLLALGLAAAALCLGAPAARGQEAAVRVHVGLALGGGSARGLAHIGVLQWLEEHRIPVDVIGGTSMGALVGGAYATGLSPREIRAEVASLDWAAILSPDSPFEYKTFRRKEDARAYPTQLQIGLKGGLRLPSGLSAGAQVELLFDRLATPYSAALRFDDLPTPFRAVATDLRTAGIVVFEAGWLAQALRASMAIPGVFSPVALGDAMLVDGSVLNNVPADVVKATGLADVVVAVDVGADLSYEQQSDSIFTVLTEATDVMIRSATRRALESADVVLQPELAGFMASDFARVEEMVELGYRAAESHAAELQRFAVSEAEYRAWVAARQARRKTTLPQPSFVRVEGVSATETANISRRLASHLGKPLDADVLDSDLRKLAGGGRYESADYRIENEEGRTGLVVSVRPKTHGPPFLSAAVDLRSTQWSDAVPTVRGRILLFDPLGSGSEARIDASFGATLLAAGDLHRPIGRRGLFAGSRIYAGRRNFSVFSDGKYVAEHRTRLSGADLDVGFSTERRVEVRAGYGIQDFLNETRVGTSGLPRVEGRQQHAHASVAFDNQDGPTLPSRGVYARAQVSRFFDPPAVVLEDGTPSPDPARLWSAEAMVSQFLPLGRHGRLFLRAEGGTSFGRTTLVHDFALGGPFRLGTFHDDELRGSHYLLANAGYFREVARLAEGAVGRLYFGIWADGGSAFDRRSSARFHTSLSGGFLVDSPIGPVLLGGSIDGDQRYRPGIDGPEDPERAVRPPQSSGLRLYVRVGPLFGR